MSADKPNKDIGEQVRELLPEYPHLWSRVISLVEMERARVQIVMPSYDMEDAAKKWCRLAPRRVAQHFYEGALWCRTHAKIGVRE